VPLLSNGRHGPALQLRGIIEQSYVDGVVTADIDESEAYADQRAAIEHEARLAAAGLPIR
jgi:hypothetical protein